MEKLNKIHNDFVRIAAKDPIMVQMALILGFIQDSFDLFVF